MSRFTLAFGVLLWLANGAALSQGVELVTLCHIPPGNPANPQTITVAEPSVQAHKAHGDAIGPCDSAEASVSGGVFTFTDQQPVPYATVTLTFAASGFETTTTTGSDGLFGFSGIPVDGTFVVTAFDPATGASGSAQEFIDAGNLNTSVSIAVDQPGSGQLAGNVQRADGLPATGAVVTYLFPDTERTGSITTDSQGNYQFDSVHLDGTIIVIAFDPATVATESNTHLLVPSSPVAIVNLTLPPPSPVQSELRNGNFTEDFDGWETSGGPAFIVPREDVFDSQTIEQSTEEQHEPLLLMPTQNGCPIMNAGVVSSAGQGVGQLSQSFTVPPGHGMLSGRIKFLSNEWPEFFGTQFNDTFLVRLTTPSGVRVLASGNVNSSSWSPGTLGFNGQTGDINFSIDVSGWVGQTLHLHFEVRDVADLLYPSGIAISDVQLLRTEQFVNAGGGAITGTTQITGAFGQAVRFNFRNLNVLGTTISVRDNTPFGETKQSIILPTGSVTFTFARFGEEPMGWDFTIRTMSDAFIVSYEMESTWVPGMPPNPCF